MSPHEFWRQMVLFLFLALITCQVGAVCDTHMTHRLLFAVGGIVAGVLFGERIAMNNDK